MTARELGTPPTVPGTVLGVPDCPRADEEATSTPGAVMTAEARAGECPARQRRSPLDGIWWPVTSQADACAGVSAGGPECKKAEASRLSAVMTAEAEPKAGLLTVPAGGSPPGRASVLSGCAGRIPAGGDSTGTVRER